MNIAPVSLSASLHPDALQASFLEILPRIVLHARISFRGLRCPERRAEAVQEVVALAWKWYRSLLARGKDAAQFPMALARYAVRAVRSGRRLCGQEPAADVFSATAQRRHRFTVEQLPSSTCVPYEQLYGLVRGQQLCDALEERLQDDARTPVPDQAAFQLDFPPFLASLSDRDRRLATYLALGHSAVHAAAQFGLSPTRVTQLRQRWCREWRTRQGEETFMAAKAG